MVVWGKMGSKPVMEEPLPVADADEDVEIPQAGLHGAESSAAKKELSLTALYTALSILYPLLGLLREPAENLGARLAGIRNLLANAAVGYGWKGFATLN